MFGWFLAAPASAQTPEFRPVPAGLTPSLTLPDLAGVDVAVGGEGPQVTLVHFFATWCEPCRDELQSLQALASSADGERLRIIAIDVGEPPIRVRRFFQALPMPFPIVLDEEKRAMRGWQVEMLPTTFLVARARWKIEGQVDWGNAAVRARISAMSNPSTQ